MSGGEDEQALLAALGFSSFGAAQRPRKRVRVSLPPPAPASSPLAQLVPGTELADALPASFPPSRVLSGPHGALYLVKGPLHDSRTLGRALERPEGDYKAAEVSGERVKRQQRSAELLARLQRTKTRFDALERDAFLAARSACNAFERIGRHRFLNRSALKLATLDHVFRLTPPHASSTLAAGTRGDHREAFAFADICGGPGGFSEYLLWRLQHRCGARVDGFGMTLRDAANRCDWRLPSGVARVVSSDGSSGPQDTGDAGANADAGADAGADADGESAATFTVCYGADGTGDVYSLANVRRFCDVVRARYPSGVALAVADGGFMDARDRDNQEAMMTRLVTAETLVMLAVLRPGGHFACKTFELATPAMRQLVWLLHQCFAELAIVKPITSRPASSERYVVARSLHENLPLQAIVERLEACVVEDAAASQTPAMLPNPAPYEDDDVFHQFMAAANDRHGNPHRCTRYKASLRTFIWLICDC